LRLLVDTHVVLGLLGFEKRMSEERRAQLADRRNDVFVSAISPWEIEIKRAKKQLSAPADILEALESTQLEALPITAEHAVAAARLPLHHRDPFDRLIVGQALVENLTIVTNDEKIARYQVAVLPA
jgi:PIN domain nuclease of toxin-antitoxin system